MGGKFGVGWDLGEGCLSLFKGWGPGPPLPSLLLSLSQPFPVPGEGPSKGHGARG